MAHGRFLVAGAAAVPALCLIVMAWPHFQEGLTHDAAMPVPVFMIQQRQLPVSLYAAAADVLAQANAADGEQVIAGAEAAMYAGRPGASQIRRLEQGLSQAPAYARGWTLLSAAASGTHPELAQKSLSQALQLAPYDYWVGGFRAQLAARMWSSLNADTRESARTQVRLLWSEPSMRFALVALSASPAGAALIRDVFSSPQGELLDVNRWLIQHHGMAAPR